MALWYAGDSKINYIQILKNCAFFGFPRQFENFHIHYHQNKVRRATLHLHFLFMFCDTTDPTSCQTPPTTTTKTPPPMTSLKNWRHQVCAYNTANNQHSITHNYALSTECMCWWAAVSM